jgi:hypothetical protein
MNVCKFFCNRGKGVGGQKTEDRKVCGFAGGNDLDCREPAALAMTVPEDKRRKTVILAGAKRPVTLLSFVLRFSPLRGCAFSRHCEGFYQPRGNPGDLAAFMRLAGLLRLRLAMTVSEDRVPEDRRQRTEDSKICGASRRGKNPQNPDGFSRPCFFCGAAANFSVL